MEIAHSKTVNFWKDFSENVGFFSFSIFQSHFESAVTAAKFLIAR